MSYPKWKELVYPWFWAVGGIFACLVIAWTFGTYGSHWYYKVKSENNTNPKYRACPCGRYGKTSKNMHKERGGFWQDRWVCDTWEWCDVRRGK